MSSKSDSQSVKPMVIKPVRKTRLDAAETRRVFIHVDEMARRPVAVPPTRYVE